MPIWPLPFVPQQYAAPTAVSSHVCAPPPSILVNAMPPATATGESRFAPAGGPSPACPLESDPQQYAACAAVIPQPWSAVVPTPSDVKTRPPASGAGVTAIVVRANWPKQ